MYVLELNTIPFNTCVVYFHLIIDCMHCVIDNKKAMKAVFTSCLKDKAETNKKAAASNDKKHYSQAAALTQLNNMKAVI